MRKAILVVALIGASFAGGAAVNGPGLAWARTFLGAGTTLVPPRDGPPAADALPAEIAVTDDASAPGGVLPAAPLPPITAPASAPAAARNAAGSAEAPKETPKAEGDAAPASPVADAAGPPLEAPKAESPAKAPEREASTPTPASLEVPAPPAPRSSPAAGDPPASKPGAAEVGWADAPGSAPAEAVLPGRPPAVRPRVDAGLAAAAMAAPASDKGWSDLRRRLRAAGVTRYWIEADPAGPVRFRCLIPQAGRRAVSQHFEGEGDDELQAAEAALKRVALWKATEGT